MTNCPICNKPTPPDSVHTCSPVPLLTKLQAFNSRVALEGQAKWQFADPEIQALHKIETGRVACHDTQAGVFVPFMSAAEALERFHKLFGDDSPRLTKDEREMYDAEWRVYFAALRDLGVIKL